MYIYCIQFHHEVHYWQNSAKPLTKGFGKTSIKILALIYQIESFHYFLKACISKHITPHIEWDDVVPLACAAYNFLPNEHSKQSPFFLMFGRDASLPLNKLLQPQV